MDTDEIDTPLSLPDTQNADSQCFTQSQDTVLNIDTQPKVWGRLCPHGESSLHTVGNFYFYR